MVKSNALRFNLMSLVSLKGPHLKEEKDKNVAWPWIFGYISRLQETTNYLLMSSFLSVLL